MANPFFAHPHEEADYNFVVSAYQHAKTGRLKERLLMVRWSLEGKTPPQIAQLLKRHVQTVRHWLHQFNAAGLDALADKPHSGRTPLLSLSQQQQTLDWVNAQLDPQGRVTCRHISTFVKQTFDCDLHPESVRRLLHGRKCSWQKAGTRDHRANAQQQQEFVEELHRRQKQENDTRFFFVMK